MSAIRFVLTAAFMLVGLFVCCVGVYGVFKLKYAANRMHAAALNDTLGVSFCLVGLAISAPDGFTALKILLVVVFLWLASPVERGARAIHECARAVSGAGARRGGAREGGTGMTIVTQMMLLFLIVCAIAVCLTRNLLTSVIIYMGYSMIMSIIWITLESPDLAITEAAVGAGVTSLLFFLTLKKIHAIDARNEVRRAHAQEKQNEQNGGADNGNA